MIVSVDTVIWETNVATDFNGVDSVKKMSGKMQVITCKNTLPYQLMYKLEVNNSKNQIFRLSFGIVPSRTVISFVQICKLQHHFCKHR